MSKQRSEIKLHSMDEQHVTWRGIQMHEMRLFRNLELTKKSQRS